MRASPGQAPPALEGKAGNPVPVLAAEWAVMHCVCGAWWGSLASAHSAMAAFSMLQHTPSGSPLRFEGARCSCLAASAQCGQGVLSQQHLCCSP